MRAYTLDQLVFFAEAGMERLPMLQAMRALGIEEDASIALTSAESTRDKNVVRLYWDYGGEYGPQLERYIDLVIAGQPPADRVGAEYSLGQLAWVHAIGLFRDDLVRDMVALGVPTANATQLADSVARHRTVLGMWKDQGQNHCAVIERYLDACMTSYEPGWPHHSAPADIASDDCALRLAP